MSLINEAIEDFSGIAFVTSKQHVDAQDSGIKRDNCDVIKLQQWLELKNSFSITISDQIFLGTALLELVAPIAIYPKKLPDKIWPNRLKNLFIRTKRNEAKIYNLLLPLPPLSKNAIKFLALIL